MCFLGGRLVSVIKEEVIPFSHKSSDFSVNQMLSVLYFGCFVWDGLIYGSFQLRCYGD